ncbi:energy transducer TonB [Parerythrobacter aurantius]|uniref:energy transducer TonB n=1 Tax=Parerythrobacter aurantius TaxID=3127706 RepID=UPI00324DB467
MLHLVFAGISLSLPISTPVRAANEADVPPGWIVSEGSSSCTASYELTRAERDGRSASVEINRSYRREAERPVRLRLPLDYDVGPGGVIGATIHLEGTDTVLGSGFVTNNASLAGSVGSFTLNADGIAMLGAGSLTPLTLVVMSAEFELDAYKTTLPPTDQVTFDTCFERVGAKLTADDRAAGTMPQTGPTAPFPKGNPGRWITMADYPSRALRNEEQGKVTVRLTVSRYGFPTGCEVVGPSGSTLLDEATCKHMMLRAQFSPARDSAFQAVESTFIQPVTWMIPE